MRCLLLIAALTGFATTAADPKAKGPANRLAKESSPYLLQHAHNPVDWYPWGPEAFAKAKKEKQARLPVDRLQLLPLVPRHGAGVVRQRGRRQDPERALRLHQGGSRGAAGHRPHLHDRPATSWASSGGWPLSMFLTADGKPIVGGTYWPPEDRKVDGETVRGFKTHPQARASNCTRTSRRSSASRPTRSPRRPRTRWTRRRAAIALVALEPQAGRRARPRRSARSSTRSTAASASRARDFRGTKFPMPPRLRAAPERAASRHEGRRAAGMRRR